MKNRWHSKVENKYNLKPKDIQRAIILKPEALHEPPFWRNNVIHAWCLSGGAGRGVYGGYDNEFWIGFYDQDAPAYKGKIRTYCTAWEGMCSYDFKTFFNPSEIENEIDFELQEKLLETLNWLIDSEIVSIPPKEKSKKVDK